MNKVVYKMCVFNKNRLTLVVYNAKSHTVQEVTTIISSSMHAVN